MLHSFDTSHNFWEYNPQLKIAFKSLYDKDKSKSKEFSSSVMWAIALSYHPDSKYRNVDEKTRRELILDNYIKEYIKDADAFDWDDFTDEIRIFKSICLSKAQRLLIAWETKMEERDAFIDSVPYNAETYKMLDDIMGKTDKMWKQYLNCLKYVEEEKDQGSLRGGGVESLKDMGEI